MTAWRSTCIATALAGTGVFLAFDAWTSGSLLRYVAAGIVFGALLCLPFVTLCLFGARARRFWRHTAFALLPVGVLLLLVEVGMRLFGPRPELPAELETDARLGHVLVPGTAGTDARGFRNAAASERTDVLFIGDSQTWGFGVALDEAFPSRYAALTGLACYQMADGSYGPVQYRELVRHGLELQPKCVVIAFYFGNDLVDAFDYAGLVGAEDVRTAGQEYRVRRNPELDGPYAPNRTMAFVDWLLASSRLLDAAANVVKAQMRGGVLDYQLGAVPCRDAHAATILLPDYRLAALDMTRPAVRDGALITARCFDATAAMCRAAGVECVLLAIPTKEYCYAQWRGHDLPQLDALRSAEQGARDDVLAAAAAAGIRVLDLAPPLVDALRSHQAPWPPSGDGHLAAAGHDVVARALRSIWPR